MDLCSLTVLCMSFTFTYKDCCMERYLLSLKGNLEMDLRFIAVILKSQDLLLRSLCFRRNFIQIFFLKLISFCLSLISSRQPYMKLNYSDLIDMMLRKFLFIRSFIRSFVHSFVRSFVRS